MAFLPILLLFAVLYVLMIRPQQRRARDHQALVASVQVGDEIMTTAGIFGTVTALEDSAIALEISPGVVVRVARAAIGQRIGPEPPEADEFNDLDDVVDVTDPAAGAEPGAPTQALEAPTQPIEAPKCSRLTVPRSGDGNRVRNWSATNSGTSTRIIGTIATRIRLTTLPSQKPSTPARNPRPDL